MNRESWMSVGGGDLPGGEAEFDVGLDGVAALEDVFVKLADLGKGVGVADLFEGDSPEGIAFLGGVGNLGACGASGWQEDVGVVGSGGWGSDLGGLDRDEVDFAGDDLIGVSLKGGVGLDDGVAIGLGVFAEESAGDLGEGVAGFGGVLTGGGGSGWGVVGTWGYGVVLAGAWIGGDVAAAGGCSGADADIGFGAVAWVAGEEDEAVGADVIDGEVAAAGARGAWGDGALKEVLVGGDEGSGGRLHGACEVVGQEDADHDDEGQSDEQSDFGFACHVVLA